MSDKQKSKSKNSSATEAEIHEESLHEDDTTPPLLLYGACAATLCALISLIVLWNYTSQEPEPEPAPIVEVPDPLPEGVVARLRTGSRTFEAKEALVRFIDEENTLQKQEKDYRPADFLEILLFEEPLTEKQIQRLSHHSRFSLAELKLLPAHPLMVLQLRYPENATGCHPTFSRAGTVFVREVVGNETTSPVYTSQTITPTVLARGGELQMACSVLEAGQTLSFHYRSRQPDKSKYLENEWEISLTETLLHVEPLASYSFSQATDAIALWNPKEENLSVGFFQEEINQKSLQMMREQETLSVLDAPSPFLLFSARVDKNTTRASGDALLHGYSLLLFAKKKERALMEQDTPFFNFSFPGKRPHTLAGPLREGGTLYLTLQGKEIRGYPEGMVVADWDFTMKPRVIVAAESQSSSEETP